MNRNTPSRFSEAPQVDIQRSRFERSCNVKTSFNVGQLIPFFIDEVLPGDTFEVSTSKVFRMQTLKTPIYDNLFVDTYFFYVPNRIVWDHWQNFLGENASSAWIPEVEYQIPQIEAPENGWNVGTIADYLGIPPLVGGLSVNALPFRGYAKICQEWFADENLQDPLVIPDGDSTVSGTNGSNYVTDTAKGSYPFIANKCHDYFTSCLPSPQKGPDIGVPVATGAVLPVFTQGLPNAHFNYGPAGDPTMDKYKTVLQKSFPLMFETDDPLRFGSGQAYGFPLFMRGVTQYSGSTPYFSFEPLTSSIVGGLGASIPDQGSETYPKTVLNTNLKSIYDNSGRVTGLTPVNLVADATQIAAFTNINELRQAFQIQRFYERLARGGSRYRELIASMFSVQIGDVRAMIPEYLGGSRLPLNVRQITQTSSNVEGQPLGDVAGMSVTNDNHFDFVKSFTEHGYIIGVMCARYKHSYQQGIEPTFLRKSLFDYYFPVFAHLGEQKVPNACIYAQGTDTDSEVFGYQEAWADYRYKPDRISASMRSVANSGFDTWHFADDYDSLPYLSADWIREDKSNVDRVLTVTSAVSDQIFADILVTNHTTRPMPLYSIPGLIDHF